MAKNKQRYVDGFVLVVPKKNTAVYKKMASEAAKMWKKFGALEYKECIGDDLAHSGGGMPFMTFLKLAKPKKRETVWFSYITYKSRAHRDAVNKKVMAEMHKQGEKYKDTPMPFDTKRMVYGGFKVLVDA